MTDRSTLCLGLLLLCLGLAGIPGAHAQGESDLFRIADIEVDVEGETAAEARADALEEVRQRAVDRLVRRLTPEEERDRLPPLTDRDRQRLIQGLQVQKEALTDTRYIATYTVRFRPEAVRELFQGAGISYSEALAPPHIVLPVYVKAGAAQLWQPDNPWAEALNSPAAQDRLIPYRFIEPEPQDRLILPAPRALAMDEEALTAFAQRHNVERLLVAIARLTHDLELGRKVVRHEFWLWPGGAGGEGWVAGRPADGEAALLAKAADRLYDRVNQRQAERTFVRAGARDRLSLAVPAATLEALVEIRQRLEGLALVQDIKLISARVPVSRIEIRFLGEQDQLVLALQEAGLRLSEGPEGYALDLIGGAYP